MIDCQIQSSVPMSSAYEKEKKRQQGTRMSEKFKLNLNIIWRANLAMKNNNFVALKQ